MQTSNMTVDIPQPKSIVHKMINLERKGSKLVTGLFRRCKQRTSGVKEASDLSETSASTSKSSQRDAPSGDMFDLIDFLDDALDIVAAEEEGIEEDYNTDPRRRFMEYDQVSFRDITEEDFNERENRERSSSTSSLPCVDESYQPEECSPCRNVSQDEFLKECIGADAPFGTVTIVHIFHKDFSDCAIVDSQLDAFLPSMPSHCRVFRLNAIDAAFVTVRLKVFRFPTILVIKDRQVLAQHTSQFGDNIMEFSLREWLKEQIV